MSLRRLWVLIKALAIDERSMTYRALDGPSYTLEQFLLADIRTGVSGVENPWRDAAGRKQRTSRARQIAARQNAWDQRRKG